MSDEPQGLELGEVADATRQLARPRPARSRTSTCPSVRATASSGPRSTRSASCCTKTEDDLLNITNFGQKSLDEVKQKLDERGLSLRAAERRETTDHAAPHASPAASAATPPHQRLMMANLAASLFAAEAIVTTEAKAKALRPIAEKLITKAKKAQDEARCGSTASARSRATSATRR